MQVSGEINDGNFPVDEHCFDTEYLNAVRKLN